MPHLAPVANSERIDSIDVLRGFALLGILVMNIQVMGMIGASYTNPTAFGDLQGINYWVWWLGHVFFDQKMMTIFSMLFGAGMVLMYERATAKTGKSTGLHYRRMLWLVLFGLAHAYLIWFGDILVAYAVCGMIYYWAKRWYATVLIIVGLAIICVPSGLNVCFDWLISNYADAETLAELQSQWQPSTEKVQAEIDAYRGSWQEQMAYRVPMSVMFETFLFAIWSFWRAGGLMLIGMALYRTGVLSGQRSKRFYAIGATIGFLIGFPLVQLGITENFQAGWAQSYSQFNGTQFNYWGSLAVSFGYVCLIMLIIKNNWMPKPVRKSLAAVGQMALTNYLLQSLIGTFIFYGHGLGYFGSVSRAGQLAIVLAIWAAQLVISPIWLARFRFGPVEWLWRSLTYCKRQPMRRRDEQLGY